jgi:hypothetical protein
VGRFRVARIRIVGLAASVFVLCLPGRAAAQLHGQHWDVTPETARATVGDTVTVHFRVRLDERDLLFDTVPKPAVTPPDWVRVISVDKLERQPDRIFVGRARLAFYRPGAQWVPIFELPFMRSVKGLSRGTLSSDSASVEIVPVIQSAASATLRDIKEASPPRGPGPLELLLGLTALAGAGWLASQARRRSPAPSVPPPEAVAPPDLTPDPYALALSRLEGIADRGAVGDVAAHYQAVADVLRDYLEAHGIPARERTTTELRWTLPSGFLSGAAGHRFEDLFAAADLVKFAHWRPDAAQAVSFLAGARELLTRWHAVQAMHAADTVELTA